MFFSAKRRRTTRAGFPATTAYGSTSAATTLAAVTDRHAREHNKQRSADAWLDLGVGPARPRVARGGRPRPLHGSLVAYRFG